MKLSQLVNELVKAGLSEEEIADRLTAKGVATTQPTINRIKSGKTKNPGFVLGNALVDLHQEMKLPKRFRTKPQEARP
jgi:transcriptional regulator with XRE-family HTH domain